MPARILAPLDGDTVSAIAGGNVTVYSSYMYGAIAQLKSHVGGASHPAVSLWGGGRHFGAVPHGLAAGQHVVSVRVESNGNPDDTQNNIKVDVTPGVFEVMAQRTSPPEPDPLPPPGVPVEFIILGAALPNTAYLAVVAYSVPLVGARTVVGGVLAIPLADKSWAVGITVPNAPNFGYIARVIQFDATDVVVRKNTVVLI
jgi:hypothetical protein